MSPTTEQPERGGLVLALVTHFKYGEEFEVLLNDQSNLGCVLFPKGI